MPLEEGRVQVAWVGPFVEDDVLCPIVIDVEIGIGQPFFCVVPRHVIVAMEEHGLFAWVEDAIAGGVKQPGDAIVTSGSAHVKVASAQMNRGLEEPSILGNAWILLIGLAIPNGLTISDFVARAAGYLVWCDAEIVEVQEGDVVVRDDDVLFSQVL